MLQFCRGVSAVRTEERSDVEFRYVTLEVQMKIYHPWVFILWFPLLVNFGLAVIICLYIPLGRPEVPAWLSFCFLFVAVVVLGVIFLAADDMVLLSRGSGEVLEKLRTFDEGWRENEISDLQRIRFLKRAKALSGN